MSKKDPNLPPSKLLDQFVLRLPDGMRDRIKRAAEINNRSMNAEIVATLEEKYPALVEGAVAQVDEVIQELKRGPQPPSAKALAVLELLKEGLRSSALAQAAYEAAIKAQERVPPIRGENDAPHGPPPSGGLDD